MRSNLQRGRGLATAPAKRIRIEIEPPEEGAASCDCCMSDMVLATASTAAQVCAQYAYQLGRGWPMERSITWGCCVAYAVNGDGYLGLYAAHCCVLSAGSREMRRLTGNGCRGSRRVVSPANGISLFLDICVGVEEAGVYLRSAFLSSSSTSCSSSVDKSPRGWPEA
jgi:hypothetical protein